MSKKILFILHIPPPVHGSSMVGKYIMDSSLINNHFDCNYINLGTSKSIEEIGKNPVGKIACYLSIVFKAVYQLLFFKPDVVYLAITAKGVGFYKDVIIAFIVKCFGVPLIFHFHNKGVSVRQNRKIDHLLYRLAFQNTKVILLSSYLYKDIQKYVKEEDVFYCPNGIPELDVDYSVNKQEGDKVQLLFLSNLIESKGVDVLLEALVLLKQKGLEFRCNFVGGEGDISKIVFRRKVNELQLEDSVFYLGKKYFQEKYEIFSKSDIFVLPTFYDNECFPLVLLEASQFSLPLVSTFEGAIPEIIEDGVNGFLVQQKDVTGLAAALENLIRDKLLRERMGTAAHAKFAREYTLKEFEGRLIEILSIFENNKL